MPITLGRLLCKILPSPPAGCALARGERRTLEKVAEVILEGAPFSIDPERVAANVDAFLVVGRSRRAWRVRALLRLIEASSLATHRRPFSLLDREKRRALITERWTTGRHIYRLCAKVRNLVILGAYADRSAAHATGYVPVELRKRFRSPTRTVAATQAS